MNEARTQLEQAVRDACDAKDFDAAATRALEAYSSEIISFLCARLRSSSDGDEAFSMFAEDIWTGLPQFAWRCSLRTWAYTLARNAANRYKVSPQNRDERNLTLAKSDRLSALIDRERTRTQLHRRTEVKNQFRALREQFDPDDQTLLILRVDRDMAWRDIAIAMSGDADLDDDAITREAARLRKNFERLKSELRRAAEAAGLVGRSD
jgi:RNA polymerase sigma-70 factor, ECF subfamily